MKTYFSHVMMVTASNTREFYVGEFKAGNPLHQIHKSFGLIFDTRSKCLTAITNLIMKEGGRLIPTPKGKGGSRTRLTNYKGNNR